MLTTVIKKPMDVMNVSAVPLCCGGADCATNAENCGESAITAKPHTNKNVMNTGSDACSMNGAAMQQQPEHNNAYHATRALPALCDQ